MAFATIKDTDSAEHVKFEAVGDTLTGYYVSSEEITINARPVTKYVFQSGNSLVDTLGSFDLNKKLARATVGANTMITLSEIKRLKGGKTLKVFKVEVDTADTIPVSGYVQPTSIQSKIDSFKNAQVK